MTADPTALIHRAAKQASQHASDVSLGIPNGITLNGPDDSEWFVNFLLGQVALWRRIAERHRPMANRALELCDYDERHWPCPDLLAVHAAAAAYLGDASEGAAVATDPAEAVAAVVKYIGDRPSASMDHVRDRLPELGRRLDALARAAGREVPQ